jgi:hypothetical protein
MGDYTFVSDPIATSSSSFAEIGHERNGSFSHQVIIGGGYRSETGDGFGFGRKCFKQCQEPGDFQCLPQLGAEVSEHKAPAFGFCLSVYFDECAEPGAVNKIDVLEANDNLCRARQEKIVNRCTQPVAFWSEHKTTFDGQNIDSVGFTLCYFQRHRVSSSCANPSTGEFFHNTFQTSQAKL